MKENAIGLGAMAAAVAPFALLIGALIYAVNHAEESEETDSGGYRWTDANRWE